VFSDPLPEEEPSFTFTPWRSHLVEPQSKGFYHLFSTTAGRNSNDTDEKKVLKRKQIE